MSLSKLLKTYCNIKDAGHKLLKTAMEKLNLSARAYDRILKVARTIADLNASGNIENNSPGRSHKLQEFRQENWAG